MHSGRATCLYKSGSVFTYMHLLWLPMGKGISITHTLHECLAVLRQIAGMNQFLLAEGSVQRQAFCLHCLQ